MMRFWLRLIQSHCFWQQLLQFAAKGLKLITGGHERRVGMFLYSISEHDKDLSLNLDRDIVIPEDVWAGMDVMILRGVTVGRDG